jgi:NAD(P)-dependent dehydrogenase (short-subunit alcohol dehydrogenase family)
LIIATIGNADADASAAPVGKANNEEIRHDPKIPLGRFGLPAEVASAVMFLASNNYAHNCELNLDGGLSAAAISI